MIFGIACGPNGWDMLVEMQPEPLRSQIKANPTGYLWDRGIFKLNDADPLIPLPVIDPDLLDTSKGQP